MEFAIYDKILIKNVIGICIVCIILCIVSVIGIVYSVRKLDKIESIVCSVGLSLAIIGTVAFSAINIPKHIYDINNNAYVVYAGEYDVVSSGKMDELVYIENGSVRLEIKVGSGLGEGKHQGTIVYAERSKIVLDITDETAKTEDGSLS